MKKSFKIILSIVIIILVLFMIDIICIFTINRPLLAIKQNDNVYKGIIYDTYNCSEYTVPQIKIKGTKFTCANVEIKEVVDIIDKTKNLKDFACAEALEQFYEDDTHEYYYSCIKSEYIVVIYNDNSEETVKDALKKGTITIKDLDNYNINYYKYEK